MWKPGEIITIMARFVYYFYGRGHRFRPVPRLLDSPFPALVRCLVFEEIPPNLRTTYCPGKGIAFQRTTDPRPICRIPGP